MDIKTFENDLEQKFFDDMKELCEEVVKNWGEENTTGAMDYAEGYAETYASKWTHDALNILQSPNWDFPKNNFRPLDFVMGEQGIKNFEDLLERENAVEIFVDWFWECFGSYGFKYNFGDALSGFLIDIDDDCEEGCEGE